jgi:hypothetical protein
MVAAPDLVWQRDHPDRARHLCVPDAGESVRRHWPISASPRRCTILACNNLSSAIRFGMSGGREVGRLRHLYASRR